MAVDPPAPRSSALAALPVLPTYASPRPLNEGVRAWPPDDNAPCRSSASVRPLLLALPAVRHPSTLAPVAYYVRMVLVMQGLSQLQRIVMFTKHIQGRFDTIEHLQKGLICCSSLSIKL